MGEACVDRFHIAHVLNHRSLTHSTVTAVYDRYRHDEEKRAARERWAEVLFGIVDITPGPRPLRPSRSLVRTSTSSWRPPDEDVRGRSSREQSSPTCARKQRQ
jgi:hypothetical protein